MFISFQIPVPFRPIHPLVHFVHLTFFDDSIRLLSDLGCLFPNFVQLAIHSGCPMCFVRWWTHSLLLLATLLVNPKIIGMFAFVEKSLEPFDFALQPVPRLRDCVLLCLARTSATCVYFLTMLLPAMFPHARFILPYRPTFAALEPVGVNP